MILLVMGVSGAGKSTIGTALAAALAWRYLDADDFHPPENVAKMAAGVPLEDADRWPWLDQINQALLKIDGAGASAVIGCSALKEAYRVRLSKGLRDFRTVFLKGSFELLRKRVESRQHRYMPASLLKSQFETLEVPARAITVDVSGTAEETLAEIRRQLGPV